MRPLLFLAAVLTLSTSIPAQANTITESLTQSYTAVTGTVEDSGGIALFNPARGTLNSVTQTLSGNVVFVASLTSGTYTFGVQGPGTPLGNFTSSASGPFSFSATNSGSALEENSDMYGQQYVIEPFDLAVVGGSLTSIGNVTDSFTFNYTPDASITPEPPSILLLGTALLAAATALRKRLA